MEKLYKQTVCSTFHIWISVYNSLRRECEFESKWFYFSVALPAMNWSLFHDLTTLL